MLGTPYRLEGQGSRAWASVGASRPPIVSVRLCLQRWRAVSCRLRDTGRHERRRGSKLYGPLTDEKFPIAAVDISKVDPKYYRRTVRYDTKEAPGTIIVDPGNYYVYRIEGDGSATRYGANVGRDGFRWNGDAYVGRKSEWATWTPPREMIKRQPEAAKWARACWAPRHPLGARTLHLYQNGAYTLYTIYASSDPESIGSGITSGCVGLLSQDMIHLYSQTPIKTKVVVLPA